MGFHPDNINDPYGIQLKMILIHHLKGLPFIISAFLQCPGLTGIASLHPLLQEQEVIIVAVLIVQELQQNLAKFYSVLAVIGNKTYSSY